MKTIIIGILSLLLAACASGPGRGDGEDAGPDGGDDAGLDGGEDAGPDGGEDAGPDGGEDAGPDGGGGDELPWAGLPLHIQAFSVSYDGPVSDRADMWVDIRVMNHQAAEALGDWSLHALTYTWSDRLLRASDLPWAVDTGQIIRWHGADYAGGTDQQIGDNQPDRWDYKMPAGTGPNMRHGVLLLRDGQGQILDLVAYETDLNLGDWLGAEALATLVQAVGADLWPCADADCAFALGDQDAWFGRLRNPLAQGQSAGDWEPAGGTIDDYYAPAAGLSGAALKAALNGIIKGHAVIDYQLTDDAFYATDADPDQPGAVIQFYTGRSTQSDFNREHLWAKSHGGFDADSQAGYSDLHHLRPTRPDVNSARWHLDFAEGGELYSDTECRRVIGLSFEPRAAVRGDVARALFYMAVRYEGDDANMPDLELVEEIPSLQNAQGLPDNDDHTNTPRMGRLSTLLAWHAQDPVDESERRRNQIIYQDFQGNRNPFVDHPEWVAAIWGD